MRWARIAGTVAAGLFAPVLAAAEAPVSAPVGVLWVAEGAPAFDLEAPVTRVVVVDALGATAHDDEVPASPPEPPEATGLSTYAMVGAGIAMLCFIFARLPRD